MTAIDSAKRQILRRMRELGVRLDRIEGELLSHTDPDWEELAAVREGDEVLERLGAAGEREIAQLRQALHRIERGTYGICANCGERIGEDRLQALPSTPLCRSCAQEVK